MRHALSLLCLVLMLGFTAPAQAQLRVNLPAAKAPVRLFDQGGASTVLNKIFSPQHFRMGHSYEMSMGSYGGNVSSLGMYTNSMQWQFNNKLAARVDVAMAHSLFGNNAGPAGFRGLAQKDGPQIFLRNAEIAYRPSENVLLNFSVRQSPYGSYMNPYGYYGYSPFERHSAELLWNDPRP